MSIPIVFCLCWCAFGLGNTVEQFRQLHNLHLLDLMPRSKILVGCAFAIFLGPLNALIESDVNTGKIYWIWNRPK